MLSSALRSSLSGVSVAGTAIRTASNNLANSQTDGFRASRVVLADQPPGPVAQGIGPVGNGVQVVAIEVDTSQGSIALSNDPLNMAIEGDAFFAFQGSGGERFYSRDGRLHLDGDGRLVDAGGRRVLGYNVDDHFQLEKQVIEPLELPVTRIPAPGARLDGVAVDESGFIRGKYSDGLTRNLGQIRLAKFSNPGDLVASHSNLLSTSPASGSPNFDTPQTSKIIGGARELSNTEISREFVNLIQYGTMFRANLQVMETADELLETLYGLRRF